MQELKKAKPTAQAEDRRSRAAIKDLTKEARDRLPEPQDIEDAVYDLKAVNPNKQAEEDKRTPAELLDIIEAKGRDVVEALPQLRSL